MVVMGAIVINIGAVHTAAVLRQHILNRQAIRQFLQCVYVSRFHARSQSRFFSMTGFLDTHDHAH